MVPFNNIRIISFSFRSSNSKNNRNDVGSNENPINNIEEALTVFSEVEEHLACSCQDRKLSNNNNNDFVNSERFDEENNKSESKGETILVEPSKSRMRRSVLNRRNEDSLRHSFNQNGNLLDTDDTSSDSWLSDYESTEKSQNTLETNKNILQRYLSNSDSNNVNIRNINKKSTSLTVSKSENGILDIDNGNTSLEDDSVAIYYDTCLACKEQHTICEESLNKHILFSEMI